MSASIARHPNLYPQHNSPFQTLINNTFFKDDHLHIQNSDLASVSLKQVPLPQQLRLDKPRLISQVLPYNIETNKYQVWRYILGRQDYNWKWKTYKFLNTCTWAGWRILIRIFIFVFPGLPWSLKTGVTRRARGLGLGGRPCPLCQRTEEPLDRARPCPPSRTGYECNGTDLRNPGVRVFSKQEGA